MKKVNIFLILFLLISFFNCNSKENKKHDQSDKLSILVSILPQYEFVKKVGGDKVSINVMIPPGAVPENYEPLPNQLKQIYTSDIYVKVGSPLPFEQSWIGKIKDLNENIKFIDMSKDVSISDNDPHIWLSLRLAQKEIENILSGLCEISPKNCAYFKDNASKYIQDLNSLDDNLKELFITTKNKSFLVFHPSWAYLASDYGLKQVAIEKHGHEPLADDIMNIINWSKTNNIKFVFISPEFDKKHAEVISKEINAKLVEIDPLAKNYLENIKEVSQKIYESLK